MIHLLPNMSRTVYILQFDSESLEEAIDSHGGLINGADTIEELLEKNDYEGSEKFVIHEITFCPVEHN